MRPTAIALGIAVLLAALAIALTGSRHSDHGPMFNNDVVLDTTQVVVTPTPQEDEPGWDCRFHGNKICGPTQAAPETR